MNSLVDNFSRKIEYLRIAVTDRCNLRCLYCRPSQEISCLPRHEMLRLGEIERLVRVGLQLGIKKVRLTGGEPLLRKGLSKFIERLKALPGLDKVSITTNGTLLEGMAEQLKAAGVSAINVSLDTLRPDRFRHMAGTDGLLAVRRGIDKAISLDFAPLKLNVVVIRGLNDEEIPDFVRLCRSDPLEVRFIEFFPIGNNGWNPEQFLSAAKVRQRLSSEFELIPLKKQDASSTADSFAIDGFLGRVSFIAPLSQDFCSHCNRLRLTADGYLKPCLMSAQEVECKPILRATANEESIARLFIRAVSLKVAGHPYRSGNWNCRREDQPVVGWQNFQTQRQMFEIGG